MNLEDLDRLERIVNSATLGPYTAYQPSELPRDWRIARKAPAGSLGAGSRDYIGRFTSSHDPKLSGNGGRALEGPLEADIVAMVESFNAALPLIAATRILANVANKVMDGRIAFPEGSKLPDVIESLIVGAGRSEQYRWRFQSLLSMIVRNDAELLRLVREDAASVDLLKTFGEPTAHAWTKTPPSEPGVYWMRGLREYGLSGDVFIAELKWAGGEWLSPGSDYGPEASELCRFEWWPVKVVPPR